MAAKNIEPSWIPHNSATDIERNPFDDGREVMKQGWGGTMDQFAIYSARP